jgi:hypothetical protein
MTELLNTTICLWKISSAATWTILSALICKPFPSAVIFARAFFSPSFFRRQSVSVLWYIKPGFAPPILGIWPSETSLQGYSPQSHNLKDRRDGMKMNRGQASGVAGIKTPSFSGKRNHVLNLEGISAF